jgi:hypothetical protein
MLPYDEKGVSEIVRTSEWVSLLPAQAEKIRKLTEMWLHTEPPPRYNDPKGLGREDGYLETLSVMWGAKSVTTEINPRGGFSPNDPLRPTKEWRELIEAIGDWN